MTRAHKDSVDNMTLDTKKKLKEKYLSDMKKGQDQVQQFLGPQSLIQTAPYKLAYTIAKHKMPFSACDAFLEFAKAADPDNAVFQKMSASRQTITRKAVEVHQKIIQADVVDGVKKSLYWSYIIDESMDKKLKEQLGIYVRYINLQEEKVAVHFLAYEDIKGRPNSTNLFNSIKSRFDEHQLPTSRLVSHTSDNAAVVVSEMNGVAGKAQREFNPKLFIQRCTTHTEVLVAKDGQKKIPSFVEKTIKDILNNFRWSGVKKQEFEDLCSLNDEKYKSLVTYHRVRWLSLESCVNRISELLQPLATYFDDQANSHAVSPAERKRNQDLYDRVSSPEFLLYLYFLKSQLPQLADINRELQKKNQTLYATYRRIFAFMRVFVSPVVCDDTEPLELLMEHENLIDISLHDVQEPPPFGAKEFRDYWMEVIENGHLSERKLKEVFSNCFNYIVTIGRAFLKRFPEADFVLKHCQFLEPERRSVRCDKSIPTVVERFNNGFFDEMEVLRSYKLYRLDDSVDDLLKSDEVDGNVVKFWCKMEKRKEFQPFARLCILLLTVQPDTCDLERGFSVMNMVKNEYRTRLTQDNLNAAVAIAMEERATSEMCFTRCLK